MANYSPNFSPVSKEASAGSQKVISLSLLPRDVGFDLKDTEHPVILPDADVYTVQYLNLAGSPIEITGDKHSIELALQREGYICGEVQKPN